MYKEVSASSLILYLFVFSIRRHQERRAILTPILTDFSVRVTAAPAIIFSKNLSPECGQAEVSIDSTQLFMNQIFLEIQSQSEVAYFHPSVLVTTVA